MTYRVGRQELALLEPDWICRGFCWHMLNDQSCRFSGTPIAARPHTTKMLAWSLRCDGVVRVYSRSFFLVRPRTRSPSPSRADRWRGMKTCRQEDD
jgi:hypothetical protein